MTKSTKTLVKNAKIFTPVSSKNWQASWQTKSYSPGAMLIDNGMVVAIGEEQEVVAYLDQSKKNETFNALGRLVTPGFVDCHTHPVFNSLRADEFEMRIKGATYERRAGKNFC
ncbi:MAG: hypothetical protein ACE5I1_24820 [bacterium]